MANRTDILPPSIDERAAVDYVMGFISIDFCHWGVKDDGATTHNFYAFDDSGERVRGSVTMTVLARRAYERGDKIFDASYMERVKVADFKTHLMGFDDDDNIIPMPWLEERALVMNDVGRVPNEKWQGFFLIFLKPLTGEHLTMAMDLLRF